MQENLNDNFCPVPKRYNSLKKEEKGEERRKKKEKKQPISSKNSQVSS